MEKLPTKIIAGSIIASIGILVTRKIANNYVGKVHSSENEIIENLSVNPLYLTNSLDHQFQIDRSLSEMYSDEKNPEYELAFLHKVKNNES